MSLPPTFLDELRSRVSLSHVVGRKVTWDMRRSNQAKGDMWAPCPFHQEKTASFHVDDRKGFYYCFGCQAKGDAIGFVCETENVGFMEAVEMLAREAGMTMPARDPAARARDARRGALADVMEDAVRFFRLHLQGAGAAAARDYLAHRGLDRDALARFEIGFAPASRRTLWEHLRGKEIGADAIVASGMAIAPDDGGTPYDRFRDRIMFPIRDARGRCIAFGGRAMSPEARAKYLNSPDTDLFDKGRSLYNHGPARAAAGGGQTLIVAEGYMDVIALVRAGFEAAVAPLGTAVTETQLDMLWRIAPEPVLALDGDTAGLGAAYRVIDRALPLLQPGKSLRFALLPEKMDPDDLIRARGADGFARSLEAALPMVDLIWQRETEGQDFDTPDRRAALEKALFDLTARIADPLLRQHYRRALKDRQWQAFGPKRGQGAGKRGAPGRTAAAPPTVGARHSLLAGGPDTAGVDLREALILAVAITTPAALDAHAEALADLPLANPEHAAIRAALLDWHAAPSGPARARIAERLGAATVENLFRPPHIALNGAVRRPGDVVFADQAIAEELSKLACRYGLAAELRETEEDIAGFADDGARAKWRLSQAIEARNNAERRQLDDRADYTTQPNGARLNRDEQGAFDALIRGIDFAKGGKSGP